MQKANNHLRYFILIFLLTTFLSVKASEKEIRTAEGIQTVSFISPTSTNEYKFGDPITISWQNSDLGANDRFSISYSIGDGPFTFIANPFHSQLTNTGDNSTYSWIAPDLGTALDNNVRIKVENTTQVLSDTSEVFRIFFEPSLEILNPISTEQYKFGETILFSWKNQDLGANDRFSITYSVDGGTFNFIANPFHSQLTNSGDTSNYSWILPDLGTTLESQIQIRIQNITRNVEDTSQAFRAYFEPDLEILNPISTEQYKFGETILFSWKNQDLGVNDRFSITYSVDGGTFNFIANPFHSQLTNSGDTSNYSWILPDLGTTLESQIQIRIQNITRNVEDTSQAFRAYFEPFVMLDLPDSTDQFKFGESVSISWLNNDLGTNDRFSITYSIDGGTYNFIANPFHSQLSNDDKRSTYAWIIPDLGTALDNQVNIRVQNTSRNVADTTSTFRIYFEPKVEILAPATDQYVLQGGTTQISWDNGDLGTNDRFSLTYSLDGGTFNFVASPFHSQLVNDGMLSTYTWSVPLIESSNVRFRVQNTTRSKSDTTGAFTVCLTCPALSISSPNGGEQFRVGNTSPITWSTGDTWVSTDSVVVDYSLDAGVSYELSTIFQGNYGAITANSTTWTIPDNVSSTVRIRVRNVTQSISDESNANFSILPALVPSLSLIKPNGGEALTGGQLFNIQWAAQNINNTDSLYLEYSTDNGLTFQLITKALYSTYNGRYTWSVPDEASTEAIVRVSNMTNIISDNSDNTFSIISPTPVLTLIQPNGGESLTIGETFNITWTSQFIADTDSLYIDFSADGGTTYSNVTKAIFGDLDGRYAWSVPASLTELGRVRVSNLTSGLVATSQGDFSIVNPPSPTITLTQPNGGEVLEAGSQYTIQWQTTNTSTSDQITLEFSNDSGITYTTITDGTVGSFSGVFSWTVPFEVGSTSKVKVSNTTAGIFAESAADFTIEATPSITVTTPNGGESLTVGDQFEITWTSENIAPEETFIIELTTNGGGSYSEIERGAFVTSYQWTIPNLPNASSMIRVTAASSGANDRSNNFFSIIAPVSVEVTNPNGGEFWEVGSQQIITWNATSFLTSDLVQIQLSTDNGANYNIISQGPSNIYNGSLAYQLIEPASTTCLVKVVNSTQGVEDVSDAVFEIGVVNRTLTITSPNGGEQWLVGTNEIISWTTTNTIGSDQLRFEISINGGESFTQIGAITTFAAYPTNQASYSVPNTPSEDVIIQLTNITRNISDQSDAALSIVNEIAPSWLTLTGSIIGEELSIDYRLDEAGTIYLAALPSGSDIPSKEEIKLAGQNETPITDQILAGTSVYENIGIVSSASFSGDFERESFYNIHLVAEDLDGNLTAVETISSILAQFSLLEQDSITLNTLYDEYNGSSWRNTEADWKDLALSARSEITVSNDRVEGLDFSDKGILGEFSPRFLQLDALVDLDLSSNGFTSLLSMNSLSSLTTLNVADNALDFGDLLLAESFLASASNYAPQASIPTVDSDTIPAGSSVQLQAFTQGSGNTYTWTLSNILVKDQVIADATQNAFLIASLNFENMGTYKVAITNPVFPALTLQGDEVVIAASANLSGSIEGINNLPLATGSVRFYQIIEIDTGYFNARTVPVSNGLFEAKDLVLGRYLAITDSDQVDAENKKVYLPTYYKDSDLWTEADTILLFEDQNIQDYSMQFFPPPLGPDDGEGVVSGSVESDFAGGRLLERRKVKKAGCSVRRFVASGRGQQDGIWKLLAYVETNDNGEFEFNFLPAGEYRFNIEFPGIPMDPDSFVQFEIGGDGFDPNNFKLEAFITADGIEVKRVQALSIYNLGLKDLSVYPNPADDVLNISYKRLLTKGLQLDLHNLQGRLIYSRELPTGDYQALQIPVTELENGLYVATIKRLDGKGTVLSMKVIVRH